MKLLICMLLFCNISYAKSISGTVKVKGKVVSGTLYIFVKKYDGKMPMPLMVKKFESPKFPLEFSLSEADKMIKNLPLNGPFKVTARISPSGSAMDKSGVEATTKEAINLGDENIELVLGKE